MCVVPPAYMSTSACVCVRACLRARAWPSTCTWHLWAVLVSPLATVALSCPSIAPPHGFCPPPLESESHREGPRPTRCHSHLLRSSALLLASISSAGEGKNRTGSMARMAVCVLFFVFYFFIFLLHPLRCGFCFFPLFWPVLGFYVRRALSPCLFGVIMHYC